MERPSDRLLALAFVRGVGSVTLRRLATHPRFAETPLEEIGTLLPAAARHLRDADLGAARQRAGEVRQRTEERGDRVLTVADAGYPPLLLGTPDAPGILYVRGTLRPDRCLAVIGTRTPTAHGEEIARRATRHFAGRGWSVVSGLALGVDVTAHREALDAGGHTVAVLAHGLQTVAPAQHRAVAERIVEEGGALVTEYPPGTAPLPMYFAQRDRIQAGLSRGVLMVQSGLDGGSLHASRAALRYGRPLAVPVPTAQDLTGAPERVAANVVLTGGGESAAGLLRVAPERLHLVLPLRSRNDYALLEERLLAGQDDAGRLL